MPIAMPKARLNPLAVALLALTACAADEVRADTHADPLTHGAPPVPASLAAPAGNALAFSLGARGDQVYACAAKDGGFAWTLVQPEATLLDEADRRVGEHYAGPTWEATDGSTVVAAKTAEAKVDAGAIPWLLLKATNSQGEGRMAKVTYVQRIATEGGLAPTTGCDAAHVGERRGVPYRATYTFYRASPG